jgi:hypothetical protein
MFVAMLGNVTTNFVVLCSSCSGHFRFHVTSWHLFQCYWYVIESIWDLTFETSICILTVNLETCCTDFQTLFYHNLNCKIFIVRIFKVHRTYSNVDLRLLYVGVMSEHWFKSSSYINLLPFSGPWSACCWGFTTVMFLKAKNGVYLLRVL